MLACPHGCGTVYDGGRISTSRHFDTHVEKRNYKDGEMEGPWCATTVTGIQRATQERLAEAPSTVELMNSSRTITFFIMNVGFVSDRMKHDRVLTTT